MRSLTAQEEEEFQSVMHGHPKALAPSPTSKQPSALNPRREGETLIEFVFRVLHDDGFDPQVKKAPSETSDFEGRIRTQLEQAFRSKDSQSSEAAWNCSEIQDAARA